MTLVDTSVLLDVLLAGAEHGDESERRLATALRAGLVDGWFVCEIEDRGPGLDDALAGYIPPTPGQRGGEGLWIARRIVQRLELIPVPTADVHVAVELLNVERQRRLRPGVVTDQALRPGQERPRLLAPAGVVVLVDDGEELL